jgi:polyisoprenyl-phosphate glycosyltransferase
VVVLEERGGSATCELSVVVPAYGCADCLSALHERLTRTLETVTPDFEIVLVEDGGSDGSWEVIERLVAEDARVRGFRLSRNFGQHAAITAGLAQSRGDWTIVMDCDLQDPPEEIPHLYEKTNEGYEVVFGLRREKRAGLARRLLARAYFWSLRTFAGSRFEGQWGTFSILSRKVVRGFLEFRDNDRHYLLILQWLGFRTAAVEYQPADRFAGKSSYTFRRLLKHAADGMFFQTTILLKWIVYLGFLLAAAGVLTALFLVVARLSHSFYPGWTSMAVFTLTIGGFIIISTGITGLYIGKVFEQVKGRPLYLIDEVCDRIEAREPDRQYTP